MAKPDAKRVLSWLCTNERAGRLVRDSDVMRGLGLPEAEAQTLLARLKAEGLIDSRRTFTQHLGGYRHMVWDIRPTPEGRQAAGGGADDARSPRT
jgi:hypothetical protein